MKPGRELDALVAEKVMNVPKYGIDTVSISNSDMFPKPYSTDISAAWEIVEKIRLHENYVCWEISSEWKGEGDLKANSNFSFHVRFCLGRGVEWAGADTAPLAICLAALKAVGIEI